MKGFVLAAGFGERMQPLTDQTSKPLLPVMNVPAICYALFLLKEAGIEDVVVNVHYKGKKIIRFFEDHDCFGLNVTFSLEEQILGTGGGVRRCEARLGESDFVLINSDVVLDVDLSRLLDRHRASRSPATLLLHRTEGAAAFGQVGVDGDRVVGFEGVDGGHFDSGLLYTGVAVLSPTIFPYLEGGFSSIVDTGYAGLIRHHSLAYAQHDGVWQDIGHVGSYWEASVVMMRVIMALGKRMEEALGCGPHIVSLLAAVGEGSVLADTVVGEHAQIGKGASLERVLVLPGATVAEGSVIRDAIVHENGIVRMNE